MADVRRADDLVPVTHQPERRVRHEAIGHSNAAGTAIESAKKAIEIAVVECQREGSELLICGDKFLDQAPVGIAEFGVWKHECEVCGHGLTVSHVQAVPCNCSKKESKYIKNNSNIAIFNGG